MNAKGFKIIKGYFTNSELLQIEATLTDLYQMQAAKTRYKVIRSTRLDDIISMMEDLDKEALYQVQNMIAVSPPIRKVVDRLSEFVSNSLISGPGLFINKPFTKRLLYRWHSEAHYYPKRRTFLNAWFPLFGDKTLKNGTMSFKVGSHGRDYPFAEYQEASYYFRQFEIPDIFHQEFPEYHVQCKRGDLVLFDRNLVHKSNENLSQYFSFAMVARIWNPENDLTVSGDFRVTPYGQDVGRSGLIING